MDPSVVLALIVDLYSAGRVAQARIAELEAQQQGGDEPEKPEE